MYTETRRQINKQSWRQKTDKTTAHPLICPHYLRHGALPLSILALKEVHRKAMHIIEIQGKISAHIFTI
jgi:hypothetical protein